MRAVILADQVFAARERSMLDRLMVGLQAEGVQVLQMIPDETPWASGGIGEVFAPILRYGEAGPLLTRALHARRLIRALREKIPDDSRSQIRNDRLVHVVHAFGGGCWPIAAELSKRLGAGLALEVWRSGLVSRAGSLRTPGGGAGPVLFAPDRTVERALVQQHAVGNVRVAPWGVHASGHEARQHAPGARRGEATSIMVSGSGQDAHAYTAALEGIALVARERADVMVFVDADTASRARLWSAARKLGLLDRLTLVPDMEGRRELVLEGDVLVLPSARGEHRTISLDAMAAGMPVIALADSWVSALAQGRTARLVDRPDARAWAQAIGSVLSDADERQRLAIGGHEYVRQNHRVSTHVSAVLDAYEWLSSGEPIAFRTSAAS